MHATKKSVWNYYLPTVQSEYHDMLERPNYEDSKDKIVTEDRKKGKRWILGF